MTGLHQQTLAQLHAGLRAGTFTPLHLLDHYLDRIRRLDPILNTMTAHNPHAQAEATASAERYARGEARGPLDGMPCTIKDNIPVQNMPCSWGSAVYRDEIPTAEEPVVERLRSAGAVILGKTNCPEFTLEGYTANRTFGITRNPYDPQTTPGGSSGGAVAGVAAGLAAFAIGTDGGGSIRRPAGHTGLVGLKPSIGRIPRARTLPPLMFDLEVVGPLTRTVEDCRCVYAALQGADPADPRSRLVEPVRPAAPLRIRLVEQFGDNPLDPMIGRALGQVGDMLARLGHRVERGTLPIATAAVDANWPLIGQAGLHWLARQMGDRFQLAGETYKAIARAGAERSAAEYLALLNDIQALRAQAAMAFAEIDIILTPTAAAQPWPADQVFPLEIAGQRVGPRGHAIYTGWVNATGHPAIALPAEPDERGMPIGYQLVAGFGQEALLLDLAAELQAAAPWSARWPALAED